MKYLLLYSQSKAGADFELETCRVHRYAGYLLTKVILVLLDILSPFPVGRLVPVRVLFATSSRSTVDMAVQRQKKNGNIIRTRQEVSVWHVSGSKR